MCHRDRKCVPRSRGIPRGFHSLAKRRRNTEQGENQFGQRETEDWIQRAVHRQCSRGEELPSECGASEQRPNTPPVAGRLPDSLRPASSDSAPLPFECFGYGSVFLGARYPAVQQHSSIKHSFATQLRPVHCAGNFRSHQSHTLAVLKFIGTDKVENIGQCGDRALQIDFHIELRTVTRFVELTEKSVERYAGCRTVAQSDTGYTKRLVLLCLVNRNRKLLVTLCDPPWSTEPNDHNTVDLRQSRQDTTPRSELCRRQVTMPPSGYNSGR